MECSFLRNISNHNQGISKGKIIPYNYFISNHNHVSQTVALSLSNISNHYQGISKGKIDPLEISLSNIPQVCTKLYLHILNLTIYHYTSNVIYTIHYSMYDSSIIFHLYNIYEYDT